jgi:hypothetical protein
MTTITSIIVSAIGKILAAAIAAVIALHVPSPQHGPPTHPEIQQEQTQ